MKIQYDNYNEYISRQKRRVKGQPPCMIFVARKDTDNNFNIRANWHENLELQLCLSGEGYVVINGERHNMSVGDVAVLNSNTVHYNGSDSDMVYIAVVLDSEFCKDAEIDQTKLNFKPHIKSDRLAMLIGEVQSIYYNEECNCKKARLQMALLNVLIELKENYILDKKPYSKQDNSLDLVRKTIEFLRENFDKKLSLDEIAKNALTDKYLLSRKFKSGVGQTIFEYLNCYRCERAKDLIRSGTPINEVAVRCGFNNVSFFIKVFKRNTGNLPSYYKKVGK